jgi:hypothetical protein
MRTLYSITLLFLASHCFSQSNEGVKPATNTLNSAPQMNSSFLKEGGQEMEIPTERSDSVFLQEKNGKILKNKEVESNTLKKALKSTIIETREADEMLSSPPQPQKDMGAEGRKAEFYSTKISSSSQRTQRTPSTSQQAQMDETVNYFKRHSPESFEYHYYSYVAGNYSVELEKHLLEAYRLKPNNTDVHIQLAAHSIILEDTLNTKVFLTKIKEVNRISTDHLSYAKDLLQSVPKKGILITHGFEDTYSCAYLQTIEYFRSDVILISLDLLQSEAYRLVLQKQGCVLPASNLIDVEYLQSFCILNEGKNVSISLTTPKEYFQNMQSKLFVVGLTFEYHPAAFNNHEKNSALWDTLLNKTVVYQSLNEKSKQLSANYLPMLLQLRTSYKAQNDLEKMSEIDGALDKVSVQCKKYEQVQKLKNKY